MKSFVRWRCSPRWPRAHRRGSVHDPHRRHRHGATVNGSLSGGEYGGGSYVYTGGGTGFGGTVGNGRLYMDSDATNLYIGFQAGGDLNDLVTILLDTHRAGTPTRP